MSGEEELPDPRLILVILYGLFVVVLTFCFGSHVVNFFRRGRCPSFRSQVASETAEIESDGIKYERLSTDRKNEIDTLRDRILTRILGNFSLTLQKEHMLQRGTSKTLDKSQGSDVVQKDIEEGFESEANGPVDNDKSTVSKDDISEGYTHIVIPRSGVDINGNSIDGGDDAQNDNKEKREVPICCAICLSEYEVEDKVCWSCNSNCTHVFHRECIVQWLVAVGRRKSSMQRFPDSPSEKKLMNYPLECPCCRQEFILAKCDKEEV